MQVAIEVFSILGHTDSVLWRLLLVVEQLLSLIALRREVVLGEVGRCEQFFEVVEVLEVHEAELDRAEYVSVLCEFALEQIDDPVDLGDQLCVCDIIV